MLRARFAAAIRNNDLAQVRECLSIDPALVDAPVAECTPALTIAVHKRYDDLVDLLVQHNANVNATTRYAPGRPCTSYKDGTRADWITCACVY